MPMGLLPHTCYVLHTGDGHGAVFVNAVAAPGQFLALLVPSASMYVHEVGAPLLGHVRGGLHALILLRQSTHKPNYVTHSFSDMCRPD